MPDDPGARAGRVGRTAHVDDAVDVVVVGLGVAGATTLWSLARAGLRAVGVEQHEPGHVHGGSHGGTRLFRRLHWEGAHYPALADRSLARYRDLEAESGTTLLTPCAHAVVGPGDGPLVGRTRAVAQRCGTSVQVLRSRAAARAVPHLALRTDDTVLLDRAAAVVRPEATVRAAVACAAARGAQVLVGRVVREVRDGADGVVVVLDDRVLRARRVVLATGAWLATGEAARVVGAPARRVVQAWFRPVHAVDRRAPGDPARVGTSVDAPPGSIWPAFVRQVGGDRFWGLPDVDGRGVKIGGSSRLLDPDRLGAGRAGPPSPDETTPVLDFVRTWVPALAPDPVAASACVDAYTSDGDFLVGRVPGTLRLVVCGGFSGHGFTHAAAVGDLVAALCGPGGTSAADVELLRPHDPARTARAPRTDHVPVQRPAPATTP
ncbi:FAD-dependent oxidoreductase [Cellulomonas algicola]|uniref:FAD-dependent oxidoreductase n=2 Tax=Cellulomonas algicola TaxID=2071633 RepID=UPI001C3FF54B|nr:FAD-dependent oxidoreductase [Cellulomonas algicola]